MLHGDALAPEECELPQRIGGIRVTLGARDARVEVGDRTGVEIAVEAMQRLGQEMGVTADQVESVTLEHWNPKVGEMRQAADQEGAAWLSLPVNCALGFLGVTPRHTWRRSSVYQSADVEYIASRTEVKIVSEERGAKRGNNGLWNGWSPYSVSVTAGGRTERIEGDFLRRFTAEELRIKWVESLEAEFGDAAASVLERVSAGFSADARDVMQPLRAER